MDIRGSICRNLSDDLLSRKWAKLVDGSNRLSGHCAIASETLYDIVGFAAANYVPYVCSFYYRDGVKFFDFDVLGVERVREFRSKQICTTTVSKSQIHRLKELNLI